MTQDIYSRRSFLKKFALLSAGSLALGATAMACYGPPRTERLTAPEVIGMYYLDAQTGNIPLQNNLSVPVNAKFLVLFSEQMNVNVPAVIVFTDHNNVAVDNTKTWENGTMLSVSPVSNLQFSTQYTLQVADAESAQGFKLVSTSNATAVFTTASS